MTWVSGVFRRFKLMLTLAQLVYKVVLDAPRNRCASGSYDGSVKVWSTDKGEQLQSLDGGCLRIKQVVVGL